VLSPGGGTHLHTNNTQNNTNNKWTTQITTNVEECGPCPVFASFTLAFALQLRKKARKNLSQGKKNLSQVKKNLTQGTVYILPKHSHRHTHYKTHTFHTHIYTHTHIIKQYKTTTIQIKRNTVQDIPKWNSEIYGTIFAGKDIFWTRNVFWYSVQFLSETFHIVGSV
jgi:hypothetical protein